ncbi:MAG: hypothetical protein HC819_10220 [Cyclobacteriaceae bacterium]|nr:hypothetical protein [Cyclobacteriaceae bacterium]
MKNTKEIMLLQKQIEKLNADDFDLGAWKAGTIILLERLFGSENQKIDQIENIRYDQSSWALRQAKGSTNMMEMCKAQGREILHIAIDELENFGLSNNQSDTTSSPFTTVIVQALERELKISQYREVIALIKADKKIADKQKELIEKLNDFGHNCVENMLASILLAEETKVNL